ncbi:hypothetical protein F5Y08DRAFT_34476 [Xylaria arbuscula]|nr:hypothetical protein F5Y08DRAFT_34476 [Xylaria arbuscula]
MHYLPSLSQWMSDVPTHPPKLTDNEMGSISRRKGAAQSAEKTQRRRTAQTTQSYVATVVTIVATLVCPFPCLIGLAPACGLVWWVAHGRGSCKSGIVYKRAISFPPSISTLTTINSKLSIPITIIHLSINQQSFKTKKHNQPK